MYLDPDGGNIATAFLKGFSSSLYADIQSFSEFTTYASIGRFWGGDLGEKVGIAVYGIKTDIELYNTIVYNWLGINEFLHNPVDCVKKVYSEMSTENKAEFLGGITEKIAAAIILSKATGGSGSKVKAAGNSLTSRSPDKFESTLKTVKETGNPPQGYQGGRTFQNRGGNGYQKLPTVDNKGNSITYREWDVNPKVPGQNRGAERLVTGSDGSAWKTVDHYKTFTKIE